MHPAALALLAFGVALPAAADDLVVAAAASLREPVLEIARGFERSEPDVRVRAAFGASSALAAQVRAGAPVDALLSADERIVRQLEREGLVRSWQPMAGNRLVVIRREGLDVPLGRPGDLARREVRRVAVPDDAVPLGRYAREWLASRGLLDALAERVVRTEHARATLAAVDLGHADAAVVYATDARRAHSARVAFSVPESDQPRIAYAAALVAGARSDAPARRFLAYLRGTEARAALRAAGFAPPPEGSEPGPTPRSRDEPDAGLASSAGRP